MFSTLKNPSNNIIRGDGHILQCLYDEISGIAVEDELRRMLLDPESENYNLISEANRKEFLFCLFKHLCLGGQWCQYEDDINVYINITKTLYKDIIKVQKNPDTKEISTVSVVLKVVARGKENMAYFPPKPENEQNFAYLIIDPISRQITTLIHQYEGQFQCQ
ncbi:hypothetical protein C0J52_23506 [Blattella germanica]|nr:hypothetical protein C0J52_23506 [Blattella germanica]